MAAALALLIFTWARWMYHAGFVLYYGDAQAHLNLSRSILDSKTPGYDQIGTVWLPVLHLICLPFVSNGNLWSSGLAGTVPVACCFVIAGTFFYLAALDVYRSATAAIVTTACFALNPNILYLSSIPMTETVFLAGLAVLLYAECRFVSQQSVGLLVLGVVACWWMSLTRYDGWFLVPFAGLWFALSARKRKLVTLLLFTAAASIAPLYWLAHNWWETGNMLDFFNGPYSAKVIQNGQPYPGFHDWPNALLYYARAGQLCAGWGLLAIGVAGLIFARRAKALAPVSFLLLPAVFYVWSIHSSGNPIHVPLLYPFTYYNTRYGIALAAWAAFAAGALIPALQTNSARIAGLIIVGSLIPWLVRPSPANWICWKESQVNSDARRAWTESGAKFLSEQYEEGQGILTYSGSGDIAGIFCRNQIPLSDVLDIGNGPAWLLNLKQPNLFHPQLWAIVQDGDPLDYALIAGHAPYSIAKLIQVAGAPALKIYKRDR